MRCPTCDLEMNDVTDSWHTFAEAEGAEYLAYYVTIWHCPACGAITGSHEDDVEWVLEPDVAVAEG